MDLQTSGVVICAIFAILVIAAFYFGRPIHIDARVDDESWGVRIDAPAQTKLPVGASPVDDECDEETLESSSVLPLVPPTADRGEPNV